MEIIPCVNEKVLTHLPRPCCKVPSPQSPFATMDQHTQTINTCSTSKLKQLCDVMMSCCDVPWRHDIITSYDVTLWANVLHWSNGQIGKLIKYMCQTSDNHVFNLLPLTFDLWPWPSNSFEIWSINFNPHTKFCTCMSNDLPLRVLTDKHRDTGDRFYYLDRWRGW